MDSKEALKAACKVVGVKVVAESLGMSPTAIYNQINDPDKHDLLEKFVDFNNACENDICVKWVCEELNGTFIKNDDIKVEAGNYNNCMSDALREFGGMISEIGKALEDGVVTSDEAVAIRKEWEDVKRVMESFVLAGELGYINEK